MKQSVMTDHFVTILKIKSVKSLTNSEYKRLILQIYLKKLISDTFTEFFKTWLMKSQSFLHKIILVKLFLNSEGAYFRNGN